MQTAGPARPQPAGSLEKVIGMVEHEMIVEKLKESGGNMSLAAKELGLTERMIGIRVKKYGIDFKQYRK
jgi:Nif-specific regulatory protein